MVVWTNLLVAKSKERIFMQLQDGRGADRKHHSILVLAYARPDSVIAILTSCLENSELPILVFQDGLSPGANSQVKSGHGRATEAITLLAQNHPQRITLHIQDANCGTSAAMRKALEVSFQGAQKVLVLEDDCVPSPEFFDWMVKALDFSDENEGRFRMVSGAQHVSEALLPSISGLGFRVSSLSHVWGWGVTRRSWGAFNQFEKTPLEHRSTQFNWARLLRRNLPYKVYQKAWAKYVKSFVEGESLPLDVTLQLWVWASAGNIISPKRNLVLNVGADQVAANTTKGDHFQNPPRSAFWATDRRSKVPPMTINFLELTTFRLWALRRLILAKVSRMKG